MRRALLLAVLVAAPSLAAAQTTPAVGEVKNGTSQGAGEPIRDDEFINIDECTNAGGVFSLELVWNALRDPDLPSTDVGTQFIIFGSNKEPPAATAPTQPRFCPEADATNNLFRWQIGATVQGTAGDASHSTSIPTEQFVTATGSNFTCAADQEDKTIWLCVHHQTSGGSTNVGSAVGKLTLSLRRPPPPQAGSVVAAGGEGALDISWGEAPDPTGVQATATSYRVIVKRGTTEIFRRDVTTLTLRVEGLTNGTTYHVEVFSLSAAMNQSATAETADGTPEPITDFWEYYSQQPGAKEQGGCASGPAGALALLGIAALLAALRRRA